MRFLKYTLALALALFVAQISAPAKAEIGFDYSHGLDHLVSFDNYEIILRPKDEADGFDVKIGTKFYDLVGEDPGASPPDLPTTGDFFIQMYQANFMRVDGDPSVELPNVSQEFTGYGIQKLTGADISDLSAVKLTFGALSGVGTEVDPFGVMTPAQLGTGQVLRLFLDDLVPANGSEVFTDSSLVGTSTTGAVGTAVDYGSALTADVASATDGAFWGAFGFGAASDGQPVGAAYFTSEIDTTAISTSDRFDPFGTLNAGLNVKDFFRSEIFIPQNKDGVLSSILGQAEIYVNRKDDTGVDTSGADYKAFNSDGESNWYFSSDDPYSFALIPEPASFLVWLGLSGIALAAMRRRREHRS